MSPRLRTAAPKTQRRKINKTAEIKINDAPPGADDALLDTASVAVWLGLSTQWLEIARHRGYGPPYVRVTSRLVRYRKGDVIEYLHSRRVAPEAA
jgi:hypothetical protein